MAVYGWIAPTSCEDFLGGRTGRRAPRTPIYKRGGRRSPVLYPAWRVRAGGVLRASALREGRPPPFVVMVYGWRV